MPVFSKPDGSFDVQHLLFKINVAPPERKQLATPHTREQGEVDADVLGAIKSDG